MAKKSEKENPSKQIKTYAIIDGDNELIYNCDTYKEAEKEAIDALENGATDSDEVAIHQVIAIWKRNTTKIYHH